VMQSIAAYLHRSFSVGVKRTEATARRAKQQAATDP
jgi:hypothetical protein